MTNLGSYQFIKSLTAKIVSRQVTNLIGMNDDILLITLEQLHLVANLFVYSFHAIVFKLIPSIYDKAAWKSYI